MLDEQGGKKFTIRLCCDDLIIEMFFVCECAKLQ